MKKKEFYTTREYSIFNVFVTPVMPNIHIPTYLSHPKPTQNNRNKHRYNILHLD